MLPHTHHCTCNICQKAVSGELAADSFSTSVASFYAGRVYRQGGAWLVDYRAIYSGRYPDWKETHTEATMWLSAWNARAKLG